MCQLLGMNCNVPTDIRFSFSGFLRRGGVTDQHGDGWGIGFFEGRGCRVFLDGNPSAQSPVAELVRRYPIKALNVIAHIRKATHGRVTLANTHPFQRELWGHYWLFAHNGELHDLPPLKRGRFAPVGDTDSEHAFCWLLEELASRFAELPPSPVLHDSLAELTSVLAGKGSCNFLLSQGSSLFAHCSTQLHYLVRQAPFAAAHLIDDDITLDFRTVTSPQDRVAIIATQPLTDNEQWTALPPGELLLFHDGLPYRSSTAE